MDAPQDRVSPESPAGHFRYVEPVTLAEHLANTVFPSWVVVGATHAALIDHFRRVYARPPEPAPESVLARLRAGESPIDDSHHEEEAHADPR